MKTLGRAVRLDLLIATLALIISAGATISSVYQTHVIARQLGASVWPYLSPISTSGGGSYRLAVTNDGLGPAIIKSAALRIDGANVATYREAEARVLQGHKPPKNSSGFFGRIDKTTVIRAGDSHILIAARGIVLSQVGDLGKRVSLSLCYCSLLEQCWTVRSNQPRVAVRSCVENDGIDY